MDDPRWWLSAPAETIAEHGQACAISAGLSEEETARLIQGMLFEAGLGPDGIPLPRRAPPPWREKRRWRKVRKQERRKFLRHFARDPVSVLYVEARGEAHRLRLAAGFLEYRRDDGRESWLYLTGQEEQNEAIADLVECFHALSAARNRGGIQDQIRVAHKLGVVMVNAQYVVHRKPQLDYLSKTRSRGGSASRKGSDEERRECYFKHLGRGDQPKYAAENAGAELGVSPSTIRAAFGGRLPRSR